MINVYMEKDFTLIELVVQLLGSMYNILEWRWLWFDKKKNYKNNIYKSILLLFICKTVNNALFVFVFFVKISLL